AAHARRGPAAARLPRSPPRRPRPLAALPRRRRHPPARRPARCPARCRARLRPRRRRTCPRRTPRMTLPPEFKRALDACGAEPIHIIGGIQPPGVLLVFHAYTRQLVAASANAAALFEAPGIDALLGQPVDELLDGTTRQAVEAVLVPREAGASRFVGMTNVGPMGALHEVSAHVSGELVHVELEPALAPLMDSGDGHAAIA